MSNPMSRAGFALMPIALLLALAYAAPPQQNPGNPQRNPRNPQQANHDSLARSRPNKDAEVLFDSALNSHCGALSGATVCSVTDDVFLKTKMIELGIHRASSFGTASPVPPEYGYAFSNFCFDCRLGFICDYDNDGLSVGSPPYSGDYFVPGTPVEGWTFTYTTSAGTSSFTNAGLMGSMGISPDSIEITSDDTTHQQSVWQGHTDNAHVTVTTTIPYDKPFFHVDTCIVNTGSEDLTDLYYMRNIDPDQTVNWNSDYATYNYVKFQPASFGYSSYVSSDDPSLAVVVARGIAGYEKFVLALSATDSRAFASHGGFYNTYPPDWFDSPSTPNWLNYGGADVGLDDVTRMLLADEGIQIVYKHNVLAPAERTCFRTIFGLNVEFEEEIETAASSSPAPSPEVRTPEPTHVPTFEPTFEPTSFPTSEPTPFPTPEPTPFPTPEPTPNPSSCNDKDFAVSCGMVASLDICTKEVTAPWGDIISFQELCPLSCGCCSRGDECICDDNNGLRRFVKRRFGFHISSCKEALTYTCCDSVFFGSYLQEFCPCSCPGTTLE
jgi:hypothetical protein